MFGDDSTSDEVLSDCVRNLETFENWDSVGNTISWIAYETSGSTVGVKGHDSLDSNIGTLDIEIFEHDGDHLFSVGFWISWGFGE